MRELDRKTAREIQHSQRRTPVVDRTSSMTVGQVERFWAAATRQVLEQIQNRIDAGDGISDVLKGERIERIAAESLQDVIGR